MNENTAESALALGERVYWTYYLASLPNHARKPPTGELSRLSRKCSDLARMAEGVEMDLLEHADIALAALRSKAPMAQHTMTLSLNIWAALHRLRLVFAPSLCLPGRAMAKPLAWRWDDERNVLLLDVAGGTSLRLWPELALPRELNTLRPSQVHVLIYDDAEQAFSHSEGPRCSLTALATAPSTHLYLTSTVATYFPLTVPVSRTQAQAQLSGLAVGQTGCLF